MRYRSTDEDPFELLPSACSHNRTAAVRTSDWKRHGDRESSCEERECILKRPYTALALRGSSTDCKARTDSRSQEEHTSVTAGKTNGFASAFIM